MTLVINFSTNTMHGFSEKKKKNKQTNKYHACSKFKIITISTPCNFVN